MEFPPRHEIPPHHGIPPTRNPAYFFTSICSVCYAMLFIFFPALTEFRVNFTELRGFSEPVSTVPDHDGGRPMEVNACILITHMVYLKPKQSLGYQQHSFRLLLLCICTTGVIQTFQAFHYIQGHRLQCTTIHGAFPLLLSSLASSPFSPPLSPSTYLEPS
jgi:hypothetical protein